MTSRIVQDIVEQLASQKCYQIDYEVAGPFAMWARCDSGSEKVTYPVPTWSGCKGVTESILHMHTVWVIPVTAGICRPIKYQPYPFNYRGELRKSDLIAGGNSCQIRNSVLRDVRYKISALVVNNPDNTKEQRRVNNAHSYQEQFMRRIRRRQNFNKPFLGWAKFHARETKPLRDDTEPLGELNFVLPSLLFAVFDRPVKGEYNPSFLTNVVVEDGTVVFEPSFMQFLPSERQGGR